MKEKARVKHISPELNPMQIKAELRKRNGKDKVSYNFFETRPIEPKKKK